MGIRKLGFLAIVSLLVVPLLASADNQIVSAGFTAPRATPIAPGQLVTLFVRGLKAGPAQASSLPLPTNLAGVSVSLKQGSLFSGFAPVFRIVPLESAGLRCGGETGVPCGLTAVMVQIPFELNSCVEGLGPLSCQQQGFVFDVVATVLENGIAGDEFRLFAVRNSIHILDTCDIMARENLSQPPSSSRPLIVRPDGRLLTNSNPGRAGEVITVYAAGLGPTTPLVPTGAASPLPPAETTVFVNLDFRPNSAPGPTGGIYGVAPFAGLTPRFVGLYQVNVKLPDQLPPEARPCGSFPAAETNMTLTIVGTSSFDGAQICVQP